YSQFTLAKVKQQFQLETEENTNLFADVADVEISDLLQTILAENIPLALSVSTEKARSELIISPILVEVRKLCKHQISLFSGVEFNVDEKQGLAGVCDFIISHSREQLFVTAPIIMLAEAKNEDFKKGYGQCIAEMLAAREFSIKEAKPLDIIYGAVTIGNLWKFLKLENNIVYIDLAEYHISQIKKIMAILLYLVKSR
ncbi:MAG: hypothetical protein FD167_2131, partial [bacterium]